MTRESQSEVVLGAPYRIGTAQEELIRWPRIGSEAIHRTLIHT